MGNSVTVLADYQSTDLVKIISVSVSGDLKSVKKFYRYFVQLLLGNVLTLGMICWSKNALIKQDKNPTRADIKKASGERERKQRDSLSSISDKQPEHNFG